MKHTLKLGLCALVSAGSLMSNDVSGSFFSVRPFTQNSHFAVQNAPVDQARSTGRALKMTSLQAIPFASSSTNAADLAQYFFFDGKKELIVKEALPTTDVMEFNQDVLAADFNIATAGDALHNAVTIKPQQTVYGVALNARRYFGEKLWIGVEAPLMHVKNNMNLKERVVETSTLAAGAGIGGAALVGTMTDAFKQTAMEYGRIDGDKSKTRLADLTFKVGYDSPMLNRKDLYMTSFVGLILPTGNKPKGIYMFEPICGNGGHAGIMLGNRGEIDIKDFKSGKFLMNWGVESQYLFQNTQKRSFDLKLNGPWSRYLSMYKTTAALNAGGAANATFGTNLLTLDSNVTPGYNGTVYSGLTYVNEKWHIAASYSTHIRQAEQIELASAWQHTQATIAAYGFTAGDSNRFRKTGKSFTGLDQPTIDTATPIKQSDIDLNSAAHRAAVSNTIALVGGMHHSCQNRPYLVEGGTSYEFSRQNTALNRWGMWLKVQGSF